MEQGNMKTIQGFLIAVQFLTAIPIHKNLPMDREYIERSIRTFPLLGFVQGILYSSFLFCLVEWTPFSPLAAAFLLWLFTIVFTGGIHLDGWMDGSDAYFSYQQKEKRLEVMKDPRIGAFGVLSVIVLLSSRFLFIYEITASIHFYSFILILLIPFLGKSVMGMVLLNVPAAKKDGLAAFFQDASNHRTWKVFPLYLIVLIGISLMLGKMTVLLFLIFIAVAIGCYYFIRRKTVKWFGGITGDILGAAAEGTENILWMTLWLLHYFVMV